MLRYCFSWAAAFLLAGLLLASSQAADTVDFNRDIRPILSNQCFKCHGPDPKERKGGTDGLRLDTQEGSRADLGSGQGSIVPGKPDASELIRRIKSDDPDERMPPMASGKQLTPKEIELLSQWVAQGGTYATHWSYVSPVRAALPPVSNAAWPRNALDYFILARLEREGLKPAAEADRYALVRRVYLDLTGLPPTVEEADQFANDPAADAYERLVDRVLKKESFGEHWARMWLDLARYADSAGYADDPSRTIWAYRDYVIRSFNANKPFDQFTIEQIAGDLLANPTEEQLIATAFHRNTLTNSEGGTNDEEFRNVAIVDRVNTTWSVWMGTSMMCSQCHNHKYDPLSQQEFFRFFAILNNCEDADRRDETPLLEFFTDEQKQERSKLESEITQHEIALKTETPELLTSLAKWEAAFPKQLAWQVTRPESMVSQGGAELTLRDDNAVVVAKPQKTDVYTVTLPVTGNKLSALRLEALPHDSLPTKGPGNGANGEFEISRVVASITPPETSQISGRFVRIEIPGKQKILSLAEVQIFSASENIATPGEATQNSTDFDGPAKLAIDGNTNGNYYEGKSVTHTAIGDDPWWEVDLRSSKVIDRIVLWNRTDNGTETRLADFRISVLDDQRKLVWDQKVKEHPQPNAEFSTRGIRTLTFVAAYADAFEAGFEPAQVLRNLNGKADGKNADGKNKGWSIKAPAGKPATLTLISAAPNDIPPGSKLTVTIQQHSKRDQHTLGCFRVSVSEDARAAEYAKTPAEVVTILNVDAAQRTEDQKRKLREYYFGDVAPELQPVREQLANVRKKLTDIKPNSVPILRELAGDKRRKTQIQHRGNFLDLGEEVSAGVPAVFPPVRDADPSSRLAMGRWLVDPANPLTARVIANRFWEQTFGIGLVRTSEEFGAQGELPSHPELLDWLAVEFMESKWDVKHFLKLLVTSATYRQSSQVTPELYERDPENRLLARGPRFRLSAEMVRDQSLFVSGLLSNKMFGPSVKPPQPALGLNAAFGSTIDWKTSDGSDRYRRGLYTEWRRSNPYPSMITFDAPNREVCTIRRNRTNTPLQALVTLNDPVYVECAQSLARKMVVNGGTTAEKVRFGFRQCLARPPHDAEIQRLEQLFEQTRTTFAATPDAAKELATNPLGPLPKDMDAVELASWTVVANVLLNLDEMFMKR